MAHEVKVAQIISVSKRLCSSETRIRKAAIIDDMGILLMVFYYFCFSNLPDLFSESVGESSAQYSV